ncbi:hypothetical protein [Oscillibacter sp.]|uniref:hypothetical protein n=1 Tax=Oscillibacter sp. TaxID=1945593 RepID=UPI00289B6843|nr:hypothetical protein [Oscillibacter sp.]
MKKMGFYYIFAVLGFAVLVAGLWLLKASQSSSSIAPYLCVGFGCGIFGHNVGELISRHAVKKIPEVAKRLEIEENDERNITLRNRAQAKAYNIMLPVFGALFVSFGLMGVELKVIFLLITAYLFVCGCSVYYRIKYEKEM